MRGTRSLRSSVEFLVKGNAGIVNLNRPKALNALNHEMVKEMRPQLEKWKELIWYHNYYCLKSSNITSLFGQISMQSEDFNLLIIKGEGGKAFCAGGDIKDLTLPTYHGDLSNT